MSSFGKLIKVTFDEFSLSDEYLQFNAAQAILMLGDCYLIARSGTNLVTPGTSLPCSIRNQEFGYAGKREWSSGDVASRYFQKRS